MNCRCGVDNLQQNLLPALGHRRAEIVEDQEVEFVQARAGFADGAVLMRESERSSSNWLMPRLGCHDAGPRPGAGARLESSVAGSLLLQMNARKEKPSAAGSEPSVLLARHLQLSGAMRRCNSSRRWRPQGSRTSRFQIVIANEALPRASAASR